MENITIVVGSADCGFSPVMPYIGEKTNGTECAKQLKFYTEIGLLRCGFDVTDVSIDVKETQDIVIPANRFNADGAIILSYGSFGSRKNFNDISGCVIHHSSGRFYNGSRTLCEDICAKLLLLRDACTSPDGALSGANCKTAIIDAGFLTYFNEARLAPDPDRTQKTAEHIVMGICENYGMPYTLHDDTYNYPIISGSATGKRGVKIKLVQAALCACGYETAIDGVFGNSTELLFKEFCMNNEIHNNGITEEFWKKALVLDKSPAAIGSKSTVARYISLKLRSKLYNSSLNRMLDADTVSALNEFLSENGKAQIHSDRIESDVIEFLSEHVGGRPRLF